MRLHRPTRTAPVGDPHPGPIATILLLLLTVLTGAGSPFAGRPTDPGDVFPSPGELTSAAADRVTWVSWRNSPAR